MIQIGNQIWSNENLKTTKFRNGDYIPHIQDDAEWASLSSPAYYVSDKGDYLYNYWTIVDPRNVAPVGWRVPFESDWDTLINFIGDRSIAGKKIKSINGWVENFVNPENDEIITNIFNGTDEFGFNGVPTGFRHMNGVYIPELLSAFFIPESIDEHLAKYIFLFFGDEFAKGGMWKCDGFPIRLIKDI